MSTALVERIAAMCCPEPNTGCWLWTRASTTDGYGHISVGSSPGRVQKAHRASYAAHVGQIPEGLNVLHRCDTPACVNPAHLFLGTQIENVADRDTKNRTARGDRHGSRTKPEARPRGEVFRAAVRSGVLRGECVHTAKLTDSDVLAIRAAHADGVASSSLAKTYGVVDRTINKIVSHRTWRHV